MSRCKACDVLLTDFEATRKTLQGEYLDLCEACFMPIREEIVTIDRDDLLTNDIDPYDFSEWNED